MMQIIMYFDYVVIGRQNFIYAHFVSFHTHASLSYLLLLFLCSYLFLAVSMRECLGKHLRLISTFM